MLPVGANRYNRRKPGGNSAFLSTRAAIMLRDIAESWFKANCPVVPSINRFLRIIDMAIADDQNCWFRFGPNTTKKGGSWLVYCYEQEFFVFALDQRQASLLDLSAGTVLSSPVCVPTRTRRLREH